MSLDTSLKIAGGLAKHRNVLTRAERVERLAERGQFDLEKDSPLGLVKVGHRKVVTGKAARKAAKAAEKEE